MDFGLELRLSFDLIASLWHEREARAFVSRDELHDEFARLSGLNEIPDDDANALLLEGAHCGIDLQLNRFAIVGPDWKAWQAISEDPYFCAERYFRYAVTREGVEGFVPRDELSPLELEKIAAQLIAEGENALGEARDLEEEWNKTRSHGGQT
jgi:hypothetical protein